MQSILRDLNQNQRLRDAESQGLIRVLERATEGAERAVRTGRHPGGVAQDSRYATLVLELPATLSLVIVCIGLAIILMAFAFFVIHKDEIREQIRVLFQTAVQSLVGMRGRVTSERSATRTRLQSERCDPQFDGVIAIVNRLILRFNSPAAMQIGNTVFYQEVRRLATDLRNALYRLLQCADPEDALGIRRRLLGNDGIFEIAVLAVGRVIRIMS